MGMLISWFVLPNGKRIDMAKSATAEDAEGVGALGGDVNYHFMAQFLGVAAYALLVSETTQPTSSQLTGEVNVEGDMQRSMAQQFSPLAQRYLTLVPTITLQPGTPFKVFVEDDVYLTPWATIYDGLISSQR
jgi:type IV secretion system protein VirB10